MNKRMIAGTTFFLVLLVGLSLSWAANQLVVVREAGTNNLYSALCPTPCTFSSMAYTQNTTQVAPTSSMVPVVTGNTATLGWIVFGTDATSGCLYKGTFDVSGNFNRDWAQAGIAGACIKPNLSDLVYFADAPQTQQPSIPPACNYTYSYGPCQPDGTKTASVMSATPAGCLGTPVTVAACTYVGPAPCTGATNIVWGPCQSSSTQTATSYTATPAGCVGTPPSSVLTQSCTYVPPTNPCTSYTYTLGACQSNNTAPVVSYVGIPSGCSGGAAPATSQPCTYNPPPTNGGLGAEGVPVTMTIPGTGSSPWYGELDFSVQLPRNGSALIVNMSSTDWSSGQSVIIGLSPVTCSQIVGRGQFGPTVWSGGATPSNFVVTASSAFTAGQTVYISVCNRSNYQGGFKITWTEAN